jgi:hypothetical protein
MAAAIVVAGFISKWEPTFSRPSRLFNQTKQAGAARSFASGSFARRMAR